jgi:hypothetical protein
MQKNGKLCEGVAAGAFAVGDIGNAVEGLKLIANIL